MNSHLWLSKRPTIDDAQAPIEMCIPANWSGAFDPVEKLREWRENGIVIFEQVVPHDLIDRFVADFSTILAHPHQHNVSIEIPGKQTHTKSVPVDEAATAAKFNHLHLHSGPAVELSLVREIVDFLGLVFGSPAAVIQSLTFKNGSQQPIHIDYPYVKVQEQLAFMAASWIPLEDVHLDAGPLAYYPGGHKPEVSGFFDWGNGNILAEPHKSRTSMEFAQYLYERMHEAGVRPKTFLPRKGDVLIWHGNLPHEGLAIRDPSRSRMSYVTHYTSLEHFPRRWTPNSGDWNDRVYAINGGYVIDPPWPNDQMPSRSELRRRTSSRP